MPTTHTSAPDAYTPVRLPPPVGEPNVVQLLVAASYDNTVSALPDAFPKKYGVQNDHFEVFGLSPHQIAASVLTAMGKRELAA